MASSTASEKKDRKYRVPALEKGLHILEVLSAAPLPLSLTELSQVMERSSSELFRLLVCFEEQGYVFKDEHTNTYSLTLKLFELAHSHPPIADLLRAAEAPMGTLAHTLNESVHLSVMQHGKIVVLTEALNPGLVRLSVATGGIFSPVCTSSGRLLLAHLDDERLSTFLETNEDYACLDEHQQETLESRLDDIRQTGVSTSENENHVGVNDVAVLVGNPGVGLQAALAITWLTDVSRGDRRQEIITELINCAEQITRSIGLSS